MNNLLLAVDVGNSTVDLGLFDGLRLRATRKLDAAVHADADALLGAVRNLLKSSGCSPCVDVVAVASVVRGAAEATLDILKSMCTGPLHCLDAGTETGLKIDYENPDAVGIDRLLAAAAARAISPGDRIVAVADAGTALTVDAVTTCGVFRGGPIVPGLRLGLRALQTGTSLLPVVEPDRNVSLLGRSTQECLQSGAVHGGAAMLTTLFRRIEVRLGHPVEAYLTGGDGALLAPFVQRPVILEPALVLQGIRMAVTRRAGQTP